MQKSIALLVHTKDKHADGNRYTHESTPKSTNTLVHTSPHSSRHTAAQEAQKLHDAARWHHQGSHVRCHEWPYITQALASPQAQGVHASTCGRGHGSSRTGRGHGIPCTQYCAQTHRSRQEAIIVGDTHDTPRSIRDPTPSRHRMRRKSAAHAAAHCATLYKPPSRWAALRHRSPAGPQVRV